MILDRSPEFCLNPLIYRLLLKTDHALGDPLVGPILSPELYFEQIELWSTWLCYILNIRALDLVVLNKMTFLCFQYANVNSVTSMIRPFWPQHHSLNKLDRVPLGDVTYHISKLLAFRFMARIF